MTSETKYTVILEYTTTSVEGVLWTLFSDLLVNEWDRLFFTNVKRLVTRLASFSCLHWMTLYMYSTKQCALNHLDHTHSGYNHFISTEHLGPACSHALMLSCLCLWIAKSQSNVHKMYVHVYIPIKSDLAHWRWATLCHQCVKQPSFQGGHYQKHTR